MGGRDEGRRQVRVEERRGGREEGRRKGRVRRGEKEGSKGGR